jgi:hypothetical protein
MPWTPGASGNPKGRPPKSRALTEILQRAGKTTLHYGVNKKGEVAKKSRQAILAEMLWTAAVTGEVLLNADYGPQRLVALGGDEWLDVVKFLYAHIDGAPKTSLIDIPEDTIVAIQFVRTEGRPASKPEGGEALDA